ncbi:acetyl-CoA carboxylase biotin carboxylase subunit family protein [Amycolatopsis sp. cmx-8-4]|uniref:ATP-grasp domain-containing protein n=1 Tax=Amycolatopsis sp. cmx-8-4 TaxID=2790947 RepID=UPI00397A5539
MTKVAVFESADASGLPDLLDAAADWCELVVVNAGPQPWSADEREGIADLAEVVDAAGQDAATVAARLAALDVDGVVTLEDEWIPLVAAVAARLGLPYHDEATAEAVTHKDVQRARLAGTDLGVRAAAFTDEESLAAAIEAVGFPAVLKPVRGNGSLNVYTVDHEAGLRAALLEATGTAPSVRANFNLGHGSAGARTWLLEERLIGVPHPEGDWLSDHFSVEVLSLGEGDHWPFWLSDRFPLIPPLRETGMTGPSLLPWDVQQLASERAAAILTTLGVTTGITHLEFKLTATGPRLIEVNGRLGGFLSSIVPHVSDLNPVRLALEAAVGKAERRPVVPTGYAACVFTHVPLGGGRITALADPGELVREPGVWRVDVRSAVGETPDYRTGTNGRLQNVWVEGVTGAELHAAFVAADAFVTAGNRFE